MGGGLRMGIDCKKTEEARKILAKHGCLPCILDSKDPEGVSRITDCRFYDDCLDGTIRVRGKDFSCDKCSKAGEFDNNEHQGAWDTNEDVLLGIGIW